MHFYPERSDAQSPFADRLIAGLRFLFHHHFARTLKPGTLAAHVASSRGSSSLEALGALRYKLRRDGYRAELVAECFALFSAALPGQGEAAVAPHVLEAARALLLGAIVELAQPGERRLALALAAAVHAVRGDPVHVITLTDAAARSLAEELRVPFAALGITLGCIEHGLSAQARRDAYACAVVCGAHREIGRDYLRDGIRAGGRPGTLKARLERLAARATREPLALRGLHCALVDDADMVMLDDAQAPLVIASEAADSSRERLRYEQAVELARGLAPEADFTLEDDRACLTRAAAQLLERLVTPLGGVWASRERREALVVLALEALHVLRRGTDYRMEGTRVVFPAASGESEEAAQRQRELAKLVEVKEGCRFADGLEVAARMPVPRFFGRYLALAGVCADARGLEHEFWALYALKSKLAGRRAAPASGAPRVFLTATAKAAALIAALRAAAAAGRAALVCVRSAKAAAEVQALLADAGLEAASAIAVFPATHSPAAGHAAGELVIWDLHEARHVQAICRAHGASGCTLLLSLEDPLVAPHIGAALSRAAHLAADAGGELRPRWSAFLARLAQRRAESTGRALRLEQKASARVLDDLLAVSGQRE